MVALVSNAIAGTPAPVEIADGEGVTGTAGVLRLGKPIAFVAPNGKLEEATVVGTAGTGGVPVAITEEGLATLTTGVTKIGLEATPDTEVDTDSVDVTSAGGADAAAGVEAVEGSDCIS